MVGLDWGWDCADCVLEGFGIWYCGAGFYVFGLGEFVVCWFGCCVKCFSGVFLSCGGLVFVCRCVVLVGGGIS